MMGVKKKHVITWFLLTVSHVFLRQHMASDLWFLTRQISLKPAVCGFAEQTENNSAGFFFYDRR